ncbi:DUF3829 domain-containing protein [Neisseria sp. Ec49-e6-T10]|uniref:DUF3829 domain-containing protein n=1 Tax=Neisseria sp. Ec49-e6-T10 TaxID=3140744 RepID=UPI003EC000B4
MNKKVISVLLASLVLSLSACDDKKNSEGNDKQSASTTANGNAVENTQTKEDSVQEVSATDEAVSKKVNDYIKTNNTLMDFWKLGITEASIRWAEEDKVKVSKGDFTKIKRSGVFDRGSKALEKTLQENTVNLGELDTAAKTLLETINTYLPKWQELEKYNEAKKFEDDNGAKGKELLVSYQEGLPKIEAAYKAFDQLLDVSMKQEQAKRIALYKKEGRLLELYTEESLGSAEKMLSLFEKTDDFKNQTKIDEANKILAQLDENLDALDKEYNARKAEQDSRVDSGYGSVHRDLTSFTGIYREARKNPKKANDLVRKYNDAISSYNRIR